MPRPAGATSFDEDSVEAQSFVTSTYEGKAVTEDQSDSGSAFENPAQAGMQTSDP